MRVETSTIRIAWRSLWRNTRRTALAIAAIALSVTLVLAYNSILRAYGGWIVETITGPMLGHAQAHASGWRKDRLLERTIRDADAVLSAVRATPGVAAAAARVYAPALAARAEEGFAVIVMGVDTKEESGPARLLGDAGALQPRHAFVGKHLADLMGLRAGDEIAIVGQGVDGSLANDLFPVQAIVDTAVDLVNRQGVLLNLGDAQSLFAMPDEVHEVVIHASRADDAAAIARAVSGLPQLAGVEVMDWRTLAPEMVTLVEMIDVAGMLVLLLVFLAAAAGVANTMVMATFERTREFGMLLSLGARPSRLVRLVLAESIVLGVLGAIAGAIAGIALVAVTHRTGIDYAWLTGGGPGELSFAGLRWSLRFYPELAVADVVRAFAAVCLTSLAASAWPAMRAARLQPVRALRGS